MIALVISLFFFQSPARAGLLQTCVRWLETGRIPIARDLIAPAEYEALALEFSHALGTGAAPHFKVQDLFFPEDRVAYLDESAKGYELARILIPLHPYRSLLELTDWQGLAHFQRFENRSHTTVLNTLVGRPRNVEEDISFALALTQVAGSNQVRLSFALGPYRENALRRLLPGLRQTFGERVHLHDGNVIILREFPLTRHSTDFMRRLIHHVQDRYLQKSP